MAMMGHFFPLSDGVVAVGVLNHLWQSSVAGLAVLGLLQFCGTFPARVRRSLAWSALINFVIPLAAIEALLTRCAHALHAHLLAMSMPALAALPQRLSPLLVSSDHFSARPAWFAAGLVWIGGFLLLTGSWILRGRRLCRRLLAGALPVEGACVPAVAAASRKLPGSSPPLCLSVEEGHGPGVLGILVPILLLPRGLEEALSAREFEAILLHELIHVRRHDRWWSFCQMLLVHAFWFNPVVWQLHRRLKIEGEKSCDAAVLAISGDAISYASGIIKTLRFSLGLPQIGFAGIAAPPVTARLHEILAHPGRPRRAYGSSVLLVLGVLLLFSSRYSGSIDLKRSHPGAHRPASIVISAAPVVAPVMIESTPHKSEKEAPTPLVASIQTDHRSGADDAMLRTNPPTAPATLALMAREPAVPAGIRPPTLAPPATQSRPAPNRAETPSTAVQTVVLELTPSPEPASPPPQPMRSVHPKAAAFNGDAMIALAVDAKGRPLGDEYFPATTVIRYHHGH